VTRRHTTSSHGSSPSIINVIKTINTHPAHRLRYPLGAVSLVSKSESTLNDSARMSGVQNITIISAQTVPQPKPHTTYTIQGALGLLQELPFGFGILIPVSTPMRTWTVDRRYNDFVALNTELVSSTNKQPPAGLPPKHPWSLTRSAYDDKVGGGLWIYTSSGVQMRRAGATVTACSQDEHGCDTFTALCRRHLHAPLVTLRPVTTFRYSLCPLTPALPSSDSVHLP